MTLNPFDEQLEGAEQTAATLAAALQEVTQEIEWFVGTRLDTLLGQLDELRSEVVVRSGECDRISAEAVQMEKDLRAVSRSIGPLWDPINWLDWQQYDRRARAKALQTSLKETTKGLPQAQVRLADVERREKEKEAEIERHRAFDLDTISNERSDLAQRLSQQKRQVEALSSRKQQVDAAIEPMVSQIREIDQKRSEAVGAELRAHELDDRLSRAQNSYDRAMVHQACEKEFGKGSPRKVVSEKEAEVRRFERDREKLETRARNVASQAAGDVQRLVLDGNNLCYEGDRFIGLDALRALVSALPECYDVVVVFDSSMRRALQSGDTEIRDAFPANVKVHVVATGVKADETVLDLAGSDQTALVVSNDRFAEFGEKPAVKEGRLIRHEIVAGRVFIHDLGVSAVYGD